MKGPTNAEIDTPTADGDKAHTPQAPKHKTLIDAREAPNSEPQVKRKKLNDELSDEEFEKGLKEVKTKEDAKREAGTVTPNPRGDAAAGAAEAADEDSEDDSDFDPDKSESEGELGSGEEGAEDSEDDDDLDDEEDDGEDELNDEAGDETEKEKGGAVDVVKADAVEADAVEAGAAEVEKQE